MHSMHDMVPAKRAENMTINWSQDAEKVLAAGLGQIPYVGGVLAALLGILWPKDHEDVWGEMRVQVQVLINQAIFQDDYNRVQAQLGSASEGTGLIGVLQNYLEAVDGTNGQDIKATWTAANTTFIGASGEFEQSGCEVLLLPMFAQMANLHLTLLGMGFYRNFAWRVNCSRKLCRTRNGQLDGASKLLLISRPSIKTNSILLTKSRASCRLTSENFSHLWPYFDPTLHPKAIQNIPLGSEIFYTITETINSTDMELLTPNYSPPGTRAGYVNEVDVYSFDSENRDLIFLGGCNVTYDSAAGSSGYAGVPFGKVTPPPLGDQKGYGTYSLTKTSVGPPVGGQGNWIVQIDGNWSANKYIRYVKFTFQNKSFTQIPSVIDTKRDTNRNFSIIPPDGYFLSSLWMPSATNYYYATPDAVFGFQNFSRFKDPTEAITFDPQGWAQTCPVAGSLNWVKGYSVQYAIAWIYKDATYGNLISWCDPISGGPWALPTLLLPTNTDPNIVGRRVYRKFATGGVQCVGTIDASTVRFPDDTL